MKLQLYYDGGCPLCTREIDTYRRLRGAEGVDWIDLTRADDATLAGIDREQALTRLTARLPDGRRVDGARAFAALWQALPALAWAGRIAALPGVVHVLELGYRLFLKVRPLWRKPGVCPVR